MNQVRNRIKELKTVKGSDLKPHPRNWRIHPDTQRTALKSVLEEIGIADALLVRELGDGTYQLIDGHLRADELKDQDVSVLVLDVNEAEAETILTTLDPLAGLAVCDDEMYRQLLMDVSARTESLRPMINDLANRSNILLHENSDIESDEDNAAELIDRASELNSKWNAKIGDLWEIGNHRLLCGDSTNHENASKLMGGKDAALIATDPPYGVDYANVLGGRPRQKTGGWDEIHGDSLSDNQLEQMLLESLSAVVAPVLFCWHSWRHIEAFLRAIRKCGWSPNSEIVWVKPGLTMGMSDYQWQHECCIYAKKEGHGRQPDRTCSTVWQFSRVQGACHPTQKPVELYHIPLKNHTSSSDICYDPFLGSGTTMVACEQLGRRCFGIELDPKYCAVILERMTDLGLTPSLVT